MASARRESAILGVIAGALIAFGGPMAAWAEEDPVDFASGPIVDTAGALGARTAEVEAAIDRATDASGRQLFVAYVDEFTNPEAADAWANDTAIANNMGTEDYLLAVAVDGRAYYLSADSEASLSDSDLQRIMQKEEIEPALQDDDWAGAAIAAADAIGDTGGGGGGWGFVWFIVGAAIVVSIIAIVLARRRRTRAGAEHSGRPSPPSVEDLRRQAGSALVQADDAVKTSEEELGFAVASYGEEATAGFRAALDGAKAKLAEAFALQQQLDDVDPDTDEEKRAWYGGIIRLAGEADALLDEQAERFDALRALERNARAKLDRVRAGGGGRRRGSRRPARARLAGLASQYAASAIAPIADNPDQAAARLAFAGQELQEAATAIAAGQAGDAAVGIRGAEEAVDQAGLLADAVERLAVDLAAADQAVAAGVADLERDAQTGRGLGDAQIGALAERVASDAAEISSAMASPGRDPLAAHARIEQVERRDRHGDRRRTRGGQ